jgi:hypothetical protein
VNGVPVIPTRSPSVCRSQPMSDPACVHWSAGGASASFSCGGPQSAGMHMIDQFISNVEK